MKNEHFRLVRRRNHPAPGNGIASVPHQMAIVSRARDFIPHQTRMTSGKPLRDHTEVINPSCTTISLPDSRTDQGTMSLKSLVFLYPNRSLSRRSPVDAESAPGERLWSREQGS